MPCYSYIQMSEIHYCPFVLSDKEIVEKNIFYNT